VNNLIKPTVRKERMAQDKNAKQSRQGKKGLCGPVNIILDNKETIKETTTLLSNQGKKEGVS
jgi:hypothetical protein